MSEENSAENSETNSGDAAVEQARAVAAQRRRRKSGQEPPPLTTPPAGVLDKPVDPSGPPPPPGRPVLVASALVAEFAAQTYNGLTAAWMPGLQPGYQPLVQPTSNAYGVMPHAQHYVTAEFDADESMVPPGARQPVSRLLWLRGWRVRKDLYDAVCARRSEADQEAARLAPAKLPEGADALPPDTEPEAAAAVTAAQTS
jgi:hypothetical protein